MLTRLVSGRALTSPSIKPLAWVSPVLRDLDPAAVVDFSKGRYVEPRLGPELVGDPTFESGIPTIDDTSGGSSSISWDPTRKALQLTKVGVGTARARWRAEPTEIGAVYRIIVSAHPDNTGTLQADKTAGSIILGQISPGETETFFGVAQSIDEDFTVKNFADNTTRYCTHFSIKKVLPALLQPANTSEFFEAAVFPAKTLVGPGGNYYDTTALTPPRDWSDGVLKLLLEAAATNVFTNNQWIGAVPGVVGSGGALPNNTFTNNTDIITVHGVTVENGMQVLDFTWSYHNSGGGTDYPRFRETSVSLGTAAQGQTWVGSAWVHVVSTTHQISQFVEERGDAPSYSYLEGSAVAVTPGSWQKVITERAFTHVDTRRTSLLWGPSVPSGETFTCRMKIGLAQLERDLSTSFIKTSGSAVTREADYLELNDLIKALRSANSKILVWQYDGLPLTLAADVIDNGQSYAGLAVFAAGTNTTAIEALKWSEL